MTFRMNKNSLHRSHPDEHTRSSAHLVHAVVWLLLFAKCKRTVEWTVYVHCTKILH